MKKSTKTVRYFYGITWTYGVATDSDGDRCGSYRRFNSAAERAEWLDAGPDDRTAPGYRSAVPASDSEIRQIVRDTERGIRGPWDCCNA